jgi:hypothetical protein
VKVDRFLATLTSTESKQAHPALTEAVYLLACYFTTRFHQDQSLGDLEEHFLSRTRTALNESLAFSDRLVDFIRGSNLVGYYLLMKGRVLEG